MFLFAGGADLYNAWTNLTDFMHHTSQGEVMWESLLPLHTTQGLEWGILLFTLSFLNCMQVITRDNCLCCTYKYHLSCRLHEFYQSVLTCNPLEWARFKPWRNPIKLKHINDMSENLSYSRDYMVAMQFLSHAKFFKNIC